MAQKLRSVTLIPSASPPANLTTQLAKICRVTTMRRLLGASGHWMTGGAVILRHRKYLRLAILKQSHRRSLFLIPINLMKLKKLLLLNSQKPVLKIKLKKNTWNS